MGFLAVICFRSQGLKLLVGPLPSLLDYAANLWGPQVVLFSRFGDNAVFEIFHRNFQWLQCLYLYNFVPAVHNGLSLGEPDEIIYLGLLFESPAQMARIAGINIESNGCPHSSQGINLLDIKLP